MKQESDRSRQMYRRKRHEEIVKKSVKKPARYSRQVVTGSK